MQTLNNIQYQLGESPIWNNFTNSLFWVDIDSYKVLQFDDHKTQHYYIPNKKPTSLHLVDNNLMFVTVEDGYGVLDLRNEEFVQLYTLPSYLINNTRLNDGKCDRNGNLWISSKDLYNKKRSGYLFKMVNKELKPIVDHVGIGNGLAFSPMNTKMYFADSLIGKLFTFDYDNGILSNKQTFYTSNKQQNIVPDGGTVDISGNYYSAMWGSGSVYVFNSDSNNVSKILNVPSLYASSCCFGGRDMNTLFVTTAIDKSNSTGGFVYHKKMDTYGINESRIKM